jgi:hypothetical protein
MRVVLVLAAAQTLRATSAAKISAGGGMGTADEEEAADAMDGGGATPARTCAWTSPGGVKFDLRGMRRTDHDYLGTTPGGYTYRFNVCAGTVKVCNRQAAPASKWRGSKCNNLGDMQTQDFALIDPADPYKGLKVTYKDGDICKKQVNGQMEIGSREVTYEIQCDSSQSPGMLKHIQEVSMCDYTVSFLSKHGCPAGGGGGMHGWTLIFWILFGACAYLGIGIGFNRYRTPDLPLAEAVPNLGFWKELPGLVKDGVVFTTEKAKVGFEFAQQKYAALNQQAT